ncbi:hypothetical protein [Clostridium cadaveris]|uniref:hypothetical protein n=1 Tax=Clostridium cadaveris TaxID=1529 RepID=UPI0039A374CA
MSLNNEKDIYELLNDVEFDVSDEAEVVMNDIEKKKLKKRVKSSIQKYKKVNGWSRKQKITVAMIAFVILGTLISPKGREVIAAIKNKLFFNAGAGLVSTTEELYVLNEPISVKSEKEEIIIKSVIAKEKSIQVGVWVNRTGNINLTKEEYDKKERYEIYIKTLGGETIKPTGGAEGGGGEYSFITTSFQTEELLKEFTLVFNGHETDIKLVKADEKNSYDEVGGNNTDKDILIGANKYHLQSNTYITFWSDEETKQNGAHYIGYNKENINVIGNNSSKNYQLQPSPFDGSGKEFYVGKDVKEPLQINISEIILDYRLKNPVNLKIPIPKKGETIEINKDIFIEDLNEKALLKSIEGTKGRIELTVDISKYRKKDTIISIMSIGRKGWAIGAGPNDTEIKMGVDYEDLSVKEKLIGKLDMKIVNITIIRNGNWKFTVK